MQLDQLVGTHLTGSIRIPESAINELLRRPESPAPDAAIEIAPRNQLTFRYRLVHARAELPRVVDVGAAPQIRVTLASMFIAVALGIAVRRPYIDVHGRQVTIRLADLPALRPMRHIWPHVTSASLRTETGALVVDFTFAVME